MKKAAASVFFVLVIAACITYGTWIRGLWPHQIIARADEQEARIKQMEETVEECRQRTLFAEHRLDNMNRTIDMIDRVIHGKGPEQLFLGKERQK
jgi:hypothetical protein